MKKAGIVIVILLIIAGFYLWKNPIYTPEKTIKSFEVAFNNRDSLALFNTLSTDLKEKAIDIMGKTDVVMELVTAITDAIPLLKGIISADKIPNIHIDILDSNVNENTAKLNVKVSFEDSKFSMKADVDLVKIKWRWYINTITPKLF